MTQISVADVYTQAHRVLATPVLTDRPVEYQETLEADDRLAAAGIVSLQLPHPAVNAPPRNSIPVPSNHDDAMPKPAPAPTLDTSATDQVSKRKVRVSEASQAARKSGEVPKAPKRAGL